MILMGIFEAIIKNDLKLRFFEPSCESLFGSKARMILFEEKQEMPPDPSFPNQKNSRNRAEWQLQAIGDSRATDYRKIHSKRF